MQRRTTLLALFMVVVIAPKISQAQCVSARYNPSLASSIGVRVGTGWNQPGVVALPSGPGAAISKWDSGCTGMMGTKFPSLLDGAPGSFDIFIDKLSGQIPPNPRAAGCAQFAAKLDSTGHVIGGTIQFFDIDGAGKPCDTSYSMYFSSILAHELGHVLGLDDTSCAGYIMGPSLYDGINPNPAECTMADTQWTTPSEPPPAPAPPAPGGGNGGPPKNADCAPLFQCSPIVINFDDHGDYALTGAEAPVLFDIAASGILSRIGWTAAGANEAFLWLDRNHNGTADNGWELFGTVTPLRSGSPAGNGFIALAEFDDNHDGMIDENDAIWSQLQLWRDLNHDGIAQGDEIAPLPGSGVTAIDLNYHWTGRHDQFGNLFGFKSKVWIRDPKGRPTSRALYDIFFVMVQ